MRVRVRTSFLTPASKGYYRNLIAFYKHLNIKYRQADFSYSFSNLSRPRSLDSRRAYDIRTKMIYNGGSGRRGIGIPSMHLPPSAKLGAKHRPLGILAQTLRSISNIVTVLPGITAYLYITLYLVINYIRLFFLCLPVVRARLRWEDETLFEWMERTEPKGRFAAWLGLKDSWRDFVWDVMVPLFSALCTAEREDIMNHPADELLGEPFSFFVSFTAGRDMRN